MPAQSFFFWEHVLELAVMHCASCPSKTKRDSEFSFYLCIKKKKSINFSQLLEVEDLEVSQLAPR